MRIDEVLFWLATGFYGLSAVSYIFGYISGKERLFSAGSIITLAGFISHLTVIIVRWVQTGVEPFTRVAESITFGMFITVLLFLVFQFGRKRIRPLGVLVLPVVFVMMGWAGTLLEAPLRQLVPALQSWWIWLHIIGAATGFSSVFLAAGMSFLLILKEGRTGGIYERIPDPQELDRLSYRFIAGGFIMYGLMIVSGAFWANDVKGSYWNWDPVEVWSLISWLTYGIYLHLRITFGWKGKRLAWYAIFAAFFMIVSYWGVPFAVDTFHTGFRIEH